MWRRRRQYSKKFGWQSGELPLVYDHKNHIMTTYWNNPKSEQAGSYQVAGETSGFIGAAKKKLGNSFIKD